MKTSFRTTLALIILLTATAAQADFLTYSNVVAAPPGNPPAVVGFNIPQFDPANGTLNSVTLTMSGRALSTFTYDGSAASGILRVWQDNVLSVLYDGSDVLAQSQTLFLSHNYPVTLPLPGNGMELWVLFLPQSQTVFSSALDLANFTGMGAIPVGAEYYNLPVVTVTSGLVTWSLDNSSSVTAIVTYDFTPVPEPGVISILIVGGLAFVYRKRK